MATVDGSGYSTSALYQAKDYDSNALATGLQSAATYDPTQQSTSSPSSNVQYVQQLNSPNNSYQDTASSTQNSSSQSVATPQTAATTGLTAASNNTPYATYRSNLVTAPSSTVSQASVGGTNAAVPHAATTTGSNTASVGSYPVTYAGPAVVNVGQNYYTFNPQTGTYQFAGQKTATFDSSYHITGYTFGNLSAAQAANATNLSSLDGKNYMNQAQQAAAISTSSLVAGNLAAYQKDLANATAQNLADKTTGAGNTQYQSTLDYLTTHGGQLSAADAQLAGTQFAGNAGANQAQQAAIAKAQAAYTAQQAQAAQLASIGIKPIDTSAVDESNRAAMSALVSQYASGNAAFGGGASTQNATALAGQNVLNHDKAAATSYDANIANYNNALATQYAADKTATGNQLYTDIQGVQQLAQQLQQEMGQLSTSQGQKAQSQLNGLNQILQQYQQAVASYGQGSQQAMALAQGIMSTAGQLLGGIV